MTYKDSIKWLASIKNQIGQAQHQDLWHFEQAIDEIIELLKPLAKPHGRLIDVNKLKSIIGLMTSHPCGCQLETVKDVLWLLDGKVEGEYVVPTIVEAEE